MITPEQMRRFAPACDSKLFAENLSAAAAKYGILDNRHIRHWMCELHHESGGFTLLEEKLSYSAERLNQVWPKRFPTLTSAKPYARNPEALAIKVYGERGGNRPGTRDGWIYRGGGLIQLTFHDNYAAASKWTGKDYLAHPEWLRQIPDACEVAAAYWVVHGCNKVADADPDEKIVRDLHARIKANEEDDVRQHRRIINGATIGVEDVIAQLQRAVEIWP